jgi:DNA mismatch repair ATPase MutS
LEKQGKKFAPLTLYLSHGVTVITGANMGGKTIGLKLVGMLAALVQFGLYVPAEEVSTCLFDYIYFSIGDMQSIDSGLSTFGGEVSGMIDILRCSELGGLILIDELARGTNPEEGYAISRAIVKFLKDRDSITLFTTHFAGITREDGIQHLKVRGLKNVDFDEVINKHRAGISGIDLVLVHMDYTLERVEGEYNAPRDAINIARLMGLDEKILKYAEEIMNSGREE